MILEWIRIIPGDLKKIGIQINNWISFILEKINVLQTFLTKVPRPPATHIAKLPSVDEAWCSRKPKKLVAFPMLAICSSPSQQARWVSSYKTGTSEYVGGSEVMMVLAKEEKEKVLRSARTRPWEDHELGKKNRDHMQPGHQVSTSHMYHSYQ